MFSYISSLSTRFCLLLLGLCINASLAWADPSVTAVCHPALSEHYVTASNAYLKYYQLAINSPVLADALSDQLDTDSKKHTHPTEAALYLLAQYEIVQDKKEGARKRSQILQQLSDLAVQTKQRWLTDEVAFLVARNHYDNKDYALAQAQLKMTKIRAEASNNQHLLARSLKWLANIDIEALKYKQGLNKYQRAYRIFQQCGNYPQLVLILSNITTVYIHMEEWGEAKTYAERALALYQEHGLNNPFIESLLHINLGEISAHAVDSSDRKRYVERAVMLADRTPLVRAKVISRMNLSSYYVDEGEYGRAFDVAQQCVAVANSENGQHPVNTANCNESLANVSLAKGQYAQALQFARKAMVGYRAYHEEIRLLETYKLLAEIYERSENYQQALAFYKAYSDAGKAYLFDIRHNELFYLQGRFDEEVHENEIALLKSENALATATLAEKKAGTNILRMTSGFILLLLYLLYRRYSAVNKDKSVLVQSNEKLEIELVADPLTGLSNRRYLSQWKAALKRDDYPQGLAVVVVDIDHFKRINDRLGHHIGDEVLVSIADRLKTLVRHHDLIVRWGGEEFILMLVCNEQNSERCLQRICEQIADEPFALSCGEQQVTVSMGAMFVPNAGALIDHWDDILIQADKALYQVKSSGRNGYHFIPSMPVRAQC
ncbi:diguanylate cyclase [Photobacterium japonica]|uniref:diguanylate cyclase domain-containing protein n=1 Tax=Photobacterium japonica TaxID=2910235 RepID=UPI003D140016